MKMIEFFIDREVRYLHPVTDEVFTQDEYNAMMSEVAKKDREAGYRDRMGGYFDKWYQYHRSDSGKAYEEGQVAASKEMGCPYDIVFIECMS